ncbi:RagB/SusD family nutrient uptake outer membrane protein [Ravibacter arvi]|uniref:RagB/SusD family nutrient uptake outer membrane protein n=2 Tax=Bacteria TaxID=2 RepID=A0ABP8MC23_9BACT
MKTIIKFATIVLLACGVFACNEQKILREEPLDFFSPENSFVTYENFQSGLTDLYAKVREICYASTEYKPYLTATDIAQDGRYQLTARFGGHTNYLVPTNNDVLLHWRSWYKIVSNANTIIARLEPSKLSADQKKQVEAEARFFRAFAYRFLVYLWGDVPLVTEEVTAPRRDFTRTPKNDVLQQMVLDATFAAENLPAINSVTDGKISNLVAYHLLAETYISLQNYDKAIEAASVVINDGNVGLMTERFGSMATQNPTDNFLKFTQPGDVYWDLFRVGNQRRSRGNREALWLATYEIDIPGGILQSSGGYFHFHTLERVAGPVPWITLKDPDGNEGVIGLPMSDYNTAGAGVSLMMNTEYFLNDLWKEDWNTDIRNAPHNIVRDFVYTNPASKWYGKSAVKNPGSTLIAQPWRWYPHPSKITTPHQHPDGVYVDKTLGTIKNTAGALYRDQYLLRLPETYLLRAEAYLGKGDQVDAAADINVVRNRSKATPVAPGKVTIDYILDERARELVYEEPRRVTLHRVGKLVERVRKYNTLNKDEIKDYHGLWPIPFSEIEANKDVQMVQNPGYL